jgi:hypothetical protein
MNPTAPKFPLLAALFLGACSSSSPADPPPPDTGSDAGSDAEPPAPTCSAASVDGIEVAPNDVYGGPPYALGYPPYSIDGCLLAYLAAPLGVETSGPLYLRDLATGAETLLEAASEEPRRPSIAGDVIAWEATIAGDRVVRVRAGAETVTITGAFHHAGEPRAAEDGVVVTAWLGPTDLDDTDIFLFKIGEPEAQAIAPSPGQQRFPDISPTHIAFADFSEDPDGRFDENAFDLADVVVYDRLKELGSPRKREGKQAFPLLGAAGSIAYLAWGPMHPEPKFSAYELFVGDLAAAADADLVAASITTSTPYIRPIARGALVEWVEWPIGGAASLWRRRADLSEPAEQVLDGLALFGPSATAGITVVAAQTAAGVMDLRGVAREP